MRKYLNYMKYILSLLGALFILALVSCSSGADKKMKPEETGLPAVHNTLAVTVDTLRVDKPVHLNKEGFLKLVMNYEKHPDIWIYEGKIPCLIDFYADWCRPCRSTAPILDELAARYAGEIIIYKVNVDEEQELAGLFGIENIPSFLYCPLNGKPTMSSGIVGTQEETKAMFVRQIESVLLNKPKASENY
jgi:thioredoxin 1